MAIIWHMTTQQFIQAAHAVCAERGTRLTDLRELVLRLIVEAKRPIKAYDLLAQLKSRHAGAAPPTVYRALEFLTANHLVHRLESINAFIACDHPDHPHHSQFLICDECETTVELADHQVAERVSTAAKAAGFAESQHTVEVHGVCKDCNDESG